MSFKTSRMRAAEIDRAEEIHPEIAEERERAERRSNIVEAIAALFTAAIVATAIVMWFVAEGVTL